MSREMSESVVLSKKLSKTLRHAAVQMKLKIGSDGYVMLDELLRHQMFRGTTVDAIRSIVESSDKKRFELTEIDGILFIRAAQGHSLKCIDDEELLVEVLDSADIPICVHGTYKKFLPLIMDSGLNRMKRNHIHMAGGIPEEDEVISGMRKSCEVVLHIDVKAAMEAGIRFFKSSNDVILTQGLNNSGILPAEFISQVVERNKRARA
jgi:2'-phosphotransferase